MEVVAHRLSLRWFSGYDLNEPLPDHSGLTGIRERYGPDAFRRFFERITDECFEAGLVRAEAECVYGELIEGDEEKKEGRRANREANVGSATI